MASPALASTWALTPGLFEESEHALISESKSNTTKARVNEIKREAFIKLICLMLANLIKLLVINRCLKQKLAIYCCALLAGETCATITPPHFRSTLLYLTLLVSVVPLVCQASKLLGAKKNSYQMGLFMWFCLGIMRVIWVYPSSLGLNAEVINAYCRQFGGNFTMHAEVISLDGRNRAGELRVLIEHNKTVVIDSERRGYQKPLLPEGKYLVSLPDLPWSDSVNIGEGSPVILNVRCPRIISDQELQNPFGYEAYLLRRGIIAHLRARKVQLARISQEFPSRAGQESVKYESAQFLSGDGVLKHIEVDKNEQTRSLPVISSRSRNKLKECGLDKPTDGTMLNQSFSRDRILYSLVNSFGQSDGIAILVAAVWGKADLLGTDVQEVFRDTGTIHLLVVSGFHLGAIYWVLEKIFLFLLSLSYTLRNRNLVIALSSALSFCGVLAYTWVVGFSPPCVRALFALLIYVFAKIQSRQLHTCNAMFAALIFVNIIWPGGVFEAGVQFTFAALIGLIVGQRVWVFLEEISGVRSKLVTACGANLITCIVCWLFTAPLTYLWFGQINPLSPLINALVAVPFTFVTVIGGAVAMLMWALDLPFGEQLLIVISWVTEYVFYILKRLA